MGRRAAPGVVRQARRDDSSIIQEQDMTSETPVETVNRLVAAMEAGDLAAAASLYEPAAILVPQPGAAASGKGLHDALAGFIAAKPRFTTGKVKVVETGDIALYMSEWRMEGTDPDGARFEQRGVSSDILRRQPDGRWLIAIDNPFGPAILGA
jgi:uncharacterized protein (TIGR02246 family)